MKEDQDICISKYDKYKIYRQGDIVEYKGHTLIVPDPYKVPFDVLSDYFDWAIHLLEEGIDTFEMEHRNELPSSD